MERSQPSGFSRKAEGGRKGGAEELAEKLVGTVILSIDSFSVAHERQKLDEENQCPKLHPEQQPAKPRPCGSLPKAFQYGELSAWADLPLHQGPAGESAWI